MQDRASYEFLVRRHRAELMARLPAFLARNRWTKERIDAERQDQLRRLLAHAKRHSPWHAQRLAQIDPDTFTEADLGRIPPMTKADLMSNFDQIVTDKRLSFELVDRHFTQLEEEAISNTYLLDEFHLAGTSGTTGLRGLVVYNWESWLIVALGLARARAISMTVTSAKPGVRSVVLGADKGWHLSVAITQTFVPDTVVPVTLPFHEIVRQLNALQPHRIAGYPSILRQLSFAAEAGELRISPESITCSAEQLLPETRAALERTFRTRVFDAWACVEAGLLGHSCPQGHGIHLIDDLSIVEPVDQNGGPVRAGTPSSGILLTNLFNPVLPIIRYAISDSVTPLERSAACACGSQARTIAGIGGRSDDAFYYDGGIYVHPFIFDFLLSLELSLVEYQVRQTPNGARILARASRDFDRQGLARKIAAALVPHGLREPDVAIELVSEIARGATGKLIRFVPLGRQA